MGLKEKVATKRIQAYADWFFKNHLISHFDLEEKYIFPILGNDNKLVQQAISEHKRIKELFNHSEKSEEILGLIGIELDHHIRFEERILFNKIQLLANEKQLQLLAEIHEEAPDAGDWEDKVWE